MSIEEG